MTFPRLMCSLLLWASSEALTHHPLGSFSLHGLFVLAARHHLSGVGSWVHFHLPSAVPESQEVAIKYLLMDLTYIIKRASR